MGNKLSPQALVRACNEMSSRLQQAAKEVGFDFNSPGWASASALKEEIGKLKDQFDQLTFSEAYKDWSEKKRKITVKELCKDPKFRDAAKNWATLGIDERTQIIEQIGSTLQKVYSSNNRLFPPRRLSYRYYEQGQPKGAAPYFERGRATKGLTGWHCNISINTHTDAGFDDFHTAMDSAFHEALHSVHFSLMDYYPQCPNVKDHPLHDDMLMLYHSQRVNFKKYGRIAALYFANPWERDAHHQSKQFVRETSEELHTIERDNQKDLRSTNESPQRP